MRLLALALLAALLGVSATQARTIAGPVPPRPEPCLLDPTELGCVPIAKFPPLYRR